MRLLFSFTVSIIVLVFNISCKQSAKQEVTTEATYYQNPIYNSDFPDPTVIKGADGVFYAYATQVILHGKIINIQVASSHNMIDWTFIGDALPQKPTWADTTQTFWAPHVSYDSISKSYYMYYSAKSNNTQTDKCIGVAVSKNPQGPFVDSGQPIICGEGFVNIDPMAFDDPKTGKKLLYWGSGFKPIKVSELSDDRLTLKAGTETVDMVSPGKDSDYNALIEGAWMRYRDGKYYLFYSGDNCCGDKANYAVMVARSDNATGPFTRLGETQQSGSSAILVLSNDWIAPGHNSIIQDDAGNDWIYYHAISRLDPTVAKGEETDRKDKRVMLVDRIEYKDGWPYVKNRIPSTARQEAPVIK